MVRSPVTFHWSAEPSSTLVLRKVSVGYSATFKKSFVRRWLSRFSSLVKMLAAWIVTSTDESAGFSATTIEPS